MMDHLSLIFAFIAILLGFLWYRITRNGSVNNRNFECIRDKDGLLQRRLGGVEQKFALFGLDGPGIVVSAVLFTSKVSLDPSLIRKALVLLNKRFPLLRMTIHKDSDNTLWFKEMADSSRIAFNLSEDYTASQWIKVYESESCVPFDLEKGPLWRVTFLNEEYDNEQKLYTNSLVFTVNHAISDGTSRMAINAKLLEYLTDLHQAKDVKVESRPLLPPLTYLLRSKLQLSMFDKVLCKVLPTAMILKNKLMKPAKNLYLQLYPAPILQDLSIVKRTSLITRVISSEDLSKIAKAGKEHGCTVHSIITAATRLAMAQILKMGSTNTDSNNDSVLPNPLKFTTSFNVAVRKDCQPIVEQIEVGCFISIASMNIETPCHVNTTPKAFWKYTRACKDAVTEKVSKGEHYKLCKFLCSIHPDVMKRMMKGASTADKSSLGRGESLFNISNLGRFTIGNGEDGLFKIKGVYAASAEQHVGPLFANNIVSINGVLYWGLSYFPHITTKQQAEQFLDMCIDILKNGCAL